MLIFASENYNGLHNQFDYKTKLMDKRHRQEVKTKLAQTYFLSDSWCNFKYFHEIHNKSIECRILL